MCEIIEGSSLFCKLSNNVKLFDYNLFIEKAGSSVITFGIDTAITCDVHIDKYHSICNELIINSIKLHNNIDAIDALLTGHFKRKYKNIFVKNSKKNAFNILTKQYPEVVEKFGKQACENLIKKIIAPASETDAMFDYEIDFALFNRNQANELNELYNFLGPSVIFKSIDDAIVIDNMTYVSQIILAKIESKIDWRTHITRTIISDSDENNSGRYKDFNHKLSFEDTQIPLTNQRV